MVNREAYGECLRLLCLKTLTNIHMQELCLLLLTLLTIISLSVDLGIATQIMEKHDISSDYNLNVLLRHFCASLVAFDGKSGMVMIISVAFLLFKQI